MVLMLYHHGFHKLWEEPQDYTGGAWHVRFGFAEGWMGRRAGEGVVGEESDILH